MALSTSTSPPPLPSDPVEAARVEHSRLRRRVIYGTHREDVIQRLEGMVGNVRREAWPPPDMTANPARHVFSQLAGLYRQVPELDPPAGGEDIAAAMADSGYWQLAQRIQRDTLALNDLLVKVDLVEGYPVYRMVWPDMVQVRVDPRRPTRIVEVREWSPDPDDSTKWVVLVTDADARSHRAEDSTGADVSERVLGGVFSGDGYPWWVGGVPVLPYVGYHAAETGWAWDPYTGAEVIEGSVQLGAYYTLLAHVMVDASWAQRYAIGAEVNGLSLTDGGQRAEVVTDPATVLMLRAAEDAPGQPMVGQWSAPTDPGQVLDTIERYERRVVEMALGTVGVSRRDSDVRSAASLAVSREAQREAQRAYEPLFRRADLELVRLTAGLMGGPTEGWRIQYKSLPRDPQEMAAEMSRLSQLIEAGLMSRIQAYRALHPGLTHDEASEALDLIARENRLSM